MSELLEIASEVAKTVAAPIAKLAGERALAKFEKGLVDALPVLRHLKVLQMRQLQRSDEILREQMKKIQMTQEAERHLGFANICYRYFEAGAKEHREVKLKILAAAAVHTADTTNTDSFDIERDILDTVETLEPHHIYLIRYLDRHHTQRQADGGLIHVAEATFDELLGSGIAFPEPARLWLARSLVVLSQTSAIIVEGGGSVARGPSDECPRRLTIRTDPFHVIKTGRIGLSSYGCKILRYVEKGLMENESRPKGNETPRPSAARCTARGRSNSTGFQPTQT